MPTRITTEAARVALANREHDQAMADIERRTAARAAQLKADPRATDETAFVQLCVEDQTMRELTIAKVAIQVWRDGNIQSGAVATVKDDGRVSWAWPGHVERH